MTCIHTNLKSNNVDSSKSKVDKVHSRHVLRNKYNISTGGKHLTSRTLNQVSTEPISSENKTVHFKILQSITDSIPVLCFIVSWEH